MGKRDWTRDKTKPTLTKPALTKPTVGLYPLALPVHPKTPDTVDVTKNTLTDDDVVACSCSQMNPIVSLPVEDVTKEPAEVQAIYKEATDSDAEYLTAVHRGVRAAKEPERRRKIAEIKLNRMGYRTDRDQYSSGKPRPILKLRKYTRYGRVTAKVFVLKGKAEAVWDPDVFGLQKRNGPPTKKVRAKVEKIHAKIKAVQKEARALKKIAPKSLGTLTAEWM